MLPPGPGSLHFQIRPRPSHFQYVACGTGNGSIKGILVSSKLWPRNITQSFQLTFCWRNLSCGCFAENEAGDVEDNTDEGDSKPPLSPPTLWPACLWGTLLPTHKHTHIELQPSASPSLWPPEPVASPSRLEVAPRDQMIYELRADVCLPNTHPMYQV